MNPLNRLTAPLFGLCLALSSFAPRQTVAHDAGTQMSAIAKVFLAALTPEQKAKASFGFSDEERENWHFIPRERKGLPMKEMTPRASRAERIGARCIVSQLDTTREAKQKSGMTINSPYAARKLRSGFIASSVIIGEGSVRVITSGANCG